MAMSAAVCVLPRSPEAQKALAELADAATLMLAPKREKTYPYIFRWERQGRKGKFCRITVRGRKMNSVLLEFEDGGMMVTSANAIKRRPEFKLSSSVREGGRGGLSSPERATEE
jgi:hypothetical protein